ncbi:MAG: zinc dependent phospholipase C family protein [Bacilli bacterium]|nr:zinc dependent phospholipase C family protein [Bacilli bacterium]
MASTIIHLAIAKNLKDKLEIDNTKDYYLGSIAPDISKQIGINKSISHFSFNNRSNVPNINLFVKRYPTFKYNSFNLGYFIHLYTDKIWDEEFIPKITNQTNIIKLLDGSIINSTKEEISNLLYSDYTNLNISIIDEYNLDLSLFYEDFTIPDTPLNEIPVNKLDILINKVGIIIENSKQEKQYTIDINIIKLFIEETTNKILEELKKY